MPTIRAQPRLLYFGMFGPLSRLPLAALLDAGLEVAAVVVPPREERGNDPVRALAPPPGWTARPASFAARLRQTVVDLAWERGIPALEVGDLRAPAARAALADLAPDLVAVSCFPARFPGWLLALPPRGVLNLHPAPLPQGRGPDPLFWAFREPAGSGGGGVTAHLMDRGLDSGPIVAQERFPIADGTTGPELELQAAARGAALLTRAALALLDGTAHPQPQDEVAATAYPAPGAGDFVVTPDRPARWAFNFLRGTAGRGLPHRLIVGNRAWTIRAALGYDPGTTLPTPYREDADTLRVRCTPGTLTVATLATDFPQPNLEP